MLLFLGHLHRLAIDGADQRPQADVGRNHQNRRHEAVEPHPLASEQADRGRAPEGRRGVEAPHIEAFLEDHASAKKSDAGHDLGRNPSRAVRIRDRAAIGDENRRAERDQRIGPQAGEMLAPLAFEADRRAKAGGDEQIEAGLGERCGHSQLPLRANRKSGTLIELERFTNWP